MDSGKAAKAPAEIKAPVTMVVEGVNYALCERAQKTWCVEYERALINTDKGDAAKTQAVKVADRVTFDNIRRQTMRGSAPELA